MELPVVAFAIPAVREIDAGEDCVYMVRPFDSVSFAEAIMHLVSSPQVRRHLGKRAYNQVTHRFSIRRNMSEAIRILSSFTKN
jgi:glycosyltransferase involved in cell wall biosynthesis